jgi:hypothetical protein
MILLQQIIPARFVVCCVGWLCSDPAGEDAAYCKACRTSIRAHLGDLKKHAQSKKHSSSIARVNPPSSQRTLQANAGMKH